MFRRLDLINKKRTCHLARKHRMKRKESKNIYKYLDLARELRRLWNNKVMVTLIVAGTIGMVSKSLEKRQADVEIRGSNETIQTIALIK